MEVPELFQATFLKQFPPEKRRSLDTKSSAGDHFVEDLLDFSNQEAVITDVGGASDILLAAGSSTNHSTAALVDSSNSSPFSGCEQSFTAGDMGIPSFGDADQFSSDLCVPCEDLAELEWLSNFMEESFSSDDLQKLQMISGYSTQTRESSSSTRTDTVTRTGPVFNPDMTVPAKARSKRSRAAPCNWTSRLVAVQPDDVVHQAADSDKKTARKKERNAVNGGEGIRRCLHCETEKTPQWRTGPMGPKTLCNACGVRYKSGRLVPEYRPAASPTFVLTKHSNSHRKVMELRRQKEMVMSRQQHQHQNVGFNGEDYLIHQQVGPDFSQLMI